MQDHNADNQLTLPLFSDSSFNRDSEYQQNNLQVASKSENLSYSLKIDRIHTPPSRKDDDVQTRNRFFKDNVEEENKSHEIPFEKNPMTVPTIFNIPLSRVRSFFFPLLLLLILANSALLISFRLYHDAKTDDNFKSVTSALSDIGSNLAAHPILDIKLQEDNAVSCPQGYQDLVLAIWPGTFRGCDCPDGLKIGRCQESGRSDCQYYPPRGPIDISHWGGSKWCILRAEPESQYTKSSECATGFRKCSAGICVLETLDCPITNLELHKRSIVKERVRGELPIIGVEINFSDIPYRLLKQKKKGDSKSGFDEKYRFVFDSQKQNKLFDDNDFPEEVLSLPGYANLYEKTEAILSFQKRLKIVEKDICLNIDTEKLEKSSDAIYCLQEYLNRTIYGTDFIRCFTILFMMLLILVLRPLHTSWVFLLKGEGSVCWMFLYAHIGFVENILLGIQFGAIVHYRSKMIETQEYLSRLVQMGCFVDQEVSNAVMDYGTVVEEETGTQLKYSFLLLLIASFSRILTASISYNALKTKNRKYLGREWWNNVNNKGKKALFGNKKPK